jgi:hypothetical protein
MAVSPGLRATKASSCGSAPRPVPAQTTACRQAAVAAGRCRRICREALELRDALARVASR